MKRINSRAKGARGERQWRDELRAAGYEARRGQQFCGGADSPDVVCPELDFIHWEVKCVERLNVEDAIAQARRDSSAAKVPIVAHRRSFRPWLVTMDAETFFKFLRGELPPGNGTHGSNGTNGMGSGDLNDLNDKKDSNPISNPNGLGQ